jgi:enoyl-CoA hydratase
VNDHRASGPPEGDWLGSPHVRLERQGPLAWCTVDRPEARNAMTAAMYFAVRYAIDRVTRDDELTGMVLTGSGDVFIPGGDLGNATEDGWGATVGVMGLDTVPFEALRNSRKPVVSAVNGICQGGGLLMAMLSDVAIASERATFRAPELYRGVVDTGYAAYLPAQIGPARACDLLFTGRTLSSSEALDWGLITRVVAHDDLYDEARSTLEACSRTAPRARLAVKRVVNQVYGHYDRMSMEDSLSGSECAEGWLAFKERRSPTWVPESLSTGGRL